MTSGDPLPGWVARHPMLWALLSGSVVAVWCLFLFGNAVLAAAIGVAFGAANGWVWRSGGPAHKWRTSMLRRFPKKSRER